jgi:hypothetical protein
VWPSDKRAVPPYYDTPTAAVGVFFFLPKEQNIEKRNTFTKKKKVLMKNIQILTLKTMLS